MEEGIRVAQVVRPATGGIRGHVRALVTGLDQTRFACTLYGPSSLDLSPEVAPHVPVDIRAVTHPFADLRAILTLAMRLRGRADIVHAHGLRGAAIGVPAARLAGIPAIFTAHNLVPGVAGASAGRRLQRALMGRVARRAVRVAAVSRAVMETVVALGVDRERISVIPNGIDAAPFETGCNCAAVRAGFGAPLEAPLIVAVGRLAPEKGFDTLLRAFPATLDAHSEAHLILAGEGPEQERLKALITAELPHAALHVHLAGQVTAVAPLLCAADVVAIPSREEGQGIVALEAMAAGRAIVATRVGGLTETVPDGECGLLVPPDSPASLAAALIALLADPERRARFGNAGRRRVVEEYTLDRMLSRIGALYTSVKPA
jgi:glycosyltransferase involved in cell wall biosynthesis